MQEWTDFRYSSSAFEYDTAQAFTTGSNANGYTLTGLELAILQKASPPPGYTVSIYSNSGGNLGTNLGTLSNPSSLPTTGNSLSEFTSSSGISLDANTTYWVVLDVSSGEMNAGMNLKAGVGTGEDSNWGWTIADGSLWRDFDSTGAWTTYNDIWYMALKGHVK